MVLPASKHEVENKDMLSFIECVSGECAEFSVSKNNGMWSFDLINNFNRKS